MLVKYYERHTRVLVTTLHQNAGPPPVRLNTYMVRPSWCPAYLCML